MLELVMRGSAFLFLGGILLVLAGVFPPISKRYPRIMMHGFGLAILGSVIAITAAIVFAASGQTIEIPPQ